MAERISPFRGKADGSKAPQTKPHDMADMTRALRALVDPDARCELRSLRPFRSVVLPGSSVDALCESAGRLADARAVYFCLNPLRDDFDAPAAAAAGKAVSDDDIARRRWLFMDIDAVRPEMDGCATEEEKAAACAQKDTLRDSLTAAGWPEPVEVDSGNGYYLLYRIDLPNDEGARLLLRRLLHHLSDTCPGAKLDRAVHNASRIARLPGTWNRKGKDTPTRPHRLCRLLRVPDTITAVPLAALERSAGPPETTQHGSTNGKGRKSPFKSRTRDSRLERYARRILNDETLAVVLAVRGHQGGHGANNALNEAAFAVGTVLHWGCLDESEAVEQLTAAALRAGLEEAEIAPTIRSGMRAGAASPRSLPDWASPPPHETNGSAKKQDSTPAPAPPPERWQVLLDGEVIADGDPEDVCGTSDDSATDADAQRVRTFELCTIGAILQTQYPEVRWVVPDIMSEGLNILGGAPKQGKSILSLNLALTVAGGGMALGDTRVEPSDVLYLSLEDRHRRVKERAVKMLTVIEPHLSRSISSRLIVATDWPRQDAGGLGMLDLWAKRVANPGLVIIDVWNRFAPAQRPSGSAYTQDADFMAQVQRFAEARGFSVLIVHHTRKPGLKEPDDFVHEISGTLGLSGTADGILVLMRARGEKQAALHVTGRDVADRELVIMFDEATLTWRSLGTRVEHVRGKVQEAVARYLRSNRPNAFFAKDIAEAIEEDEHSVRTACRQLVAKKIIRKHGNAYAYPGDADATGAQEDDDV